MKACKLCTEPTNNKFNIDFKEVPICESCANSVMLQQAKWLADQQSKKIIKKKK